MKIFILLLGIIALASNSVECCSTSGGTSGGGGGGGGGVSSDVVYGPPTPTFEQLTACKILGHPGINLVTNNGIFPRTDGLKYNENDGADAHSNINDTCNGYQARRSWGPCPPDEVTLGGWVSLKASVLSYILDVAERGEYDRAAKLQINVIAGECHSSRDSWHLKGSAVDIQIKNADHRDQNYISWMKICSEHGPRKNLGPTNDVRHLTHTHCSFTS